MSNAQANADDVQAYRDKLQELIDGDHSRKESRKGDRKPFVGAWVGLVSITGVTAEAVDYLFDGQRMAEAEPLYRMACQDDAAKTYDDFIMTMRSSRNEGGCTLRMLLNLLALELLMPTSSNSLDFISMKLPAMSRNKKGKQFGNLASLTRKLLVHPLVGYTINTSANISITSAKNLIHLLKVPLEKMSKTHKARGADVKVVNDLLKWLEEHANAAPEVEQPAEDTSTPAQADSIDESSEAVKEEDTKDSPTDSREETETEGQPSEESAEESALLSEGADGAGAETTESDNDKAVPEEENPAPEPEAEKAGKSKAKNTIAKDKASSQQEEAEDLKTKLKKANDAKKEAEEQLDKALSLLRQTKHELDEQREQRSSLSANYADLQRRLDAIEAENVSLREDLAAAEGMMTMLEERNAHKASVADQKMIRDLKFEYQDFRYALDLDMTVDLGENMRDQLSNVFDILISNGIDL